LLDRLKPNDGLVLSENTCFVSIVDVMGGRAILASSPNEWVLQEVEDAPAQLHGGDEEVEGNDREEVGKRDLEDDGRDCEDGMQLDQLVAVVAQLFFEAETDALSGVELALLQYRDVV
jgi:hypothetical protein